MRHLEIVISLRKFYRISLFCYLKSIGRRDFI
nr:MAG TPA: hypothetical protein [Caudoviricetes sp.]